jgi:hypothetical protein
MSIRTTAKGRAISIRILQVGGGWRRTIAPLSSVRLSRLLFR